MDVKWNNVVEVPPPEGRDLLVWTGHYMIVSEAHYYDEQTRKDYAALAIDGRFANWTEKDRNHMINCRGRFIEFGTNHYFDNPRVFWTELPEKPK